MKKKYLLIIITFLIFTSSLFNNGFSAYASEEIYLGGMPAGFKLDGVGATVIGINDVIGINGLYSPSKDAGIKAGDVLLSIDGKDINKASDIEDALFDYEGNGVTAVIERDGDTIIKIVYPAKDVIGTYRMGLFIRDEIVGIGTITYIKKDGKFGALGHPVIDGNNKKIVKLNSGEVFRCNVTGVNKGVKGRAGEIRGFIYEDQPTGKITFNKNQGIFGVFDDNYICQNNLEKVNVATAKPGKATMLSTVEGTEPKEYSVSVVKYVPNSKDNKNLVIKINDSELLEKTGGILQGMSGSPILQNGKLVGAVTHVFINDPTRGFGISIENMLTA